MEKVYAWGFSTGDKGEVEQCFLRKLDVRSPNVED